MAHDELLSACDLRMARDEIANMHRIAQDEAKRQGANAYFSQEYVGAWQRFRNEPTVANAKEMLRVAPMLITYFEACSRGPEPS